MDGRQSSSPVVYVGGWDIDDRDVNGWYVVDKESLQILPPKGGEAGDVLKRKRKKTKVLGRHMYSWASVKGKPDKKREELCTALKLQNSYHGTSFIFGEDLYWFGANLRSDEIDSMELVKHGLNDDSLSSWKTLSSYPYQFTSSGFSVFPVGTKLYVLHGTDGGCDQKHFVPQDLNLRVEIYDLSSGAWQILPCPCINSLPYNYCAPFVALVENKYGEPKEFMFYSLTDGSLLFLDLASGESRIDKNHRPLALYQRSAPYKTPLGLEHCYGLENLVFTTQCSPAIFSNNTLYWFTFDFHLYGYDLELDTIWN